MRTFKRVDTWKKLLDFHKNLAPANQKASKWVFRGNVGSERSIKKAFQTSLDKAFKEFTIRGAPQKASREQETRRNRIEKRIIRSFRRRAHLLTDDKDGTQTHLETFALLRHYGGPARILDWMYSFFPA
ncbi:MAG: FRG domain-containing protein, partial [Planctomycetota bacterium]